MKQVLTQKKKTVILLENIPTVPETRSSASQQLNVLKPASSSSSSLLTDPGQHHFLKKSMKKHIGHIVVSDSESEDMESCTLSLPRELEARLMKHQLEGVQWMYGTFQRKTGSALAYCT